MAERRAENRAEAGSGYSVRKEKESPASDLLAELDAMWRLGGGRSSWAKIVACVGAQHGLSERSFMADLNND
jgi:hypothetical protein